MLHFNSRALVLSSLVLVFVAVLAGYGNDDSGEHTVSGFDYQLSIGRR